MTDQRQHPLPDRIMLGLAPDGAVMRFYDLHGRLILERTLSETQKLSPVDAGAAAGPGTAAAAGSTAGAGPSTRTGLGTQRVARLAARGKQPLL